MKQKIKFAFYILKECLYKSGNEEENGHFRVITGTGRITQRCWYRSAQRLQKMVGGIIVLNDKNIWL